MSDVPELPVHQHNLYVPEFQCDIFLNLKVISKILNVPEFSCTSAQLPCFLNVCDADASKNEDDLNVTDCS